MVFVSYRPDMYNERSAGHMRPAEHIILARELVVVSFNIFTTLHEVLNGIKIMRGRNYI
jgi:hypothetical protein